MVLCLKGSGSGSSCWGMGRRVARGIPEVASGRGTQGLASPVCVPPLVSLACLEHVSPQGNFPACCPSATGFVPPSGSPLAWPASPAHFQLPSPHNMKAEWVVVDICVAAFYHPSPSSDAMSSPLPGKPRPFSLLVYGVLMNPLPGDQYTTRFKPVKVFLAIVPGTWPNSGSSEPGSSFLGPWIKQLGKWICSLPLDWEPQRTQGAGARTTATTLLPSIAQ